MRDVRIFYKKQGLARYVSHLDINRCMQRALKRAGIAVWYTQGFNPHMYLTFALPTPLGYESECESMDLRVTDEMPLEEVCRRLQAVLPQGLTVTGADTPVHSAEEIESADYRVTLMGGGHGPQEAAQAVQQLFEQAQIPVEKHTKKGMRTVDLKPLCTLMGLTVEEDAVTLQLRLAAGTTTNINPSLFLEALKGATGFEADVVRVQKQQVYVKNGAIFR